MRLLAYTNSKVKFVATISSVIESAIQHHRAGQLAQAEQLYRQVLNIQPLHPDALHLLGVIAYQRGDHELAVNTIQQALAAEPNNPGAHNNLGSALQALQEFEQAEAHHRRAIELDPNAADAHNNLGNALKAQGKLKQATACFQRALQLKPDYVAAHNNLGSVYQARGDYPAAVSSYRRALKYNPNYAGAISNLGSVLHMLGSIDESIANFRRSLQLNPSLTEAHLGLGKVLLDHGDWDEAIGCFQQVLRLRPGCPAALHELSLLARQGRYRLEQEDLLQIQRKLNTESMSNDDRALLHFTLAAAMDQQQTYDQAFYHYEQGSQLRREFLGQQSIQADHDRYVRLVDEIVATFDHRFFQRVASFGLSTELPVFVVGMPRSGTTLVEQILASHPDVFGAGESRELGTIANDLPSRLCSEEPYPRCLCELERETARLAAEQYLAHLRSLGGNSLRVVDKMPLNYNHLGLIATFFPKSHVIHCRRDPRDVCLSCFMQYEIPYSLEGAAFSFRQYYRLMNHWKQVLPISILDVDYEQLVANQESVTREMLEFCGLPWNERCLSFYETERTVQTPSKLQVREPIHSRSIGRWKNYERHLKPLFAALELSDDGMRDDG